MAKTVIFELDNVIIVRDEAAQEVTPDANPARYPIIGLPELVKNWRLTEAEKTYARRASFLTGKRD